MKIAYTYSQTIIDNLDWVSELDDIDHDICDTAQDAKHEILRLSRIIEKLHEKLEKDQDTPWQMPISMVYLKHNKQHTTKD